MTVIPDERREIENGSQILQLGDSTTTMGWVDDDNNFIERVLFLSST